MTELHAIIPAGGAGSRLWPLSRRSHPKFLLDLTGSGRSLLQQTYQRLAPITRSITVVTGKSHAEEVESQLRELGVEDPRILIEPSPRDSMAAIGWAAYLIGKQWGGEAIVGSFAADHVITNDDAFRHCVGMAIAGAKLGYVTTLGITPTEASTAFGYIQPGAPTETPDVHQVARFIEKPDREKAEQYFAAGYLWNAGVFIIKTRVLTSALQHHLPTMDTGLTELTAKSPSEGQIVAPSELWERLPRIAIDYAVAEPAAAEGKIAVVEAPDLGWSDIGDFQALAALSPGNADAVLIDSEDAFVKVDGKTVAVLGIPGAVVIETEKSLLVTIVSRSQEVKKIVDKLHDHGRIDLL